MARERDNTDLSGDISTLLENTIFSRLLRVIRDNSGATFGRLRAVAPSLNRVLDKTHLDLEGKSIGYLIRVAADEA